jgi:excinuclease ABC subunit A
VKDLKSKKDEGQQHPSHQMSDTENTSLEYYAKHSIITDPRERGELFVDLSSNISGLVQVVQGLLIHPFAVELYHVQLSPRQREEVFLRTVAQMLARIHELDPDPLTVSREPKQRLVGNCRDHAVLFTALLRHFGIPARMRVGFARYFPSNKNEDHWITEYWDGEQARWVLTDPQLDAIQCDAYGIEFDPLDMRFYDHFYTGGHAWQLCRNGQAKSYEFGFKRWKGWGYIRGSLLHDLDALNKVELLPADWWGEFVTKNDREVTTDERMLLDRLADLTTNVDSDGKLNCFDAMRAAYEELAYSHEVHSRLLMLGVGGEFSVVAPENLRPAAGEQLAALQAERTKPTDGSSKGGRPDFALDHASYYEPTNAVRGVEATSATSSGAAVAATHASRQRKERHVGLGDIVIHGARQHNLKNIDVTIPRFKLVVITGVSGSGKSSLAFDTLYAEGQRRYVESLSAYARQFLSQMEKPEVDQIVGLCPTIAIEQKNVSRNPRSTIGTVTEVADYLRVLYARVGAAHCPRCGRGVQPQTALQITDQLAALRPGTRFQLLAPIARGRKGAHAALLEQAVKDGYTRARVDGDRVDLLADQIPSLAKTKPHTIELIVDRLITPNDDHDAQTAFRTRLADSVETTLRAGDGLLIVALEHGEEVLLCEHNACPYCDISFPELGPALFSFNAASGMCPDCNGLGIKLSVDPDLIVSKPHLSLLDGASLWFGEMRKKPRWWAHPLFAAAEHYDVDLELPWNQLTQAFREVALYGSGDERIRFTYQVEREDRSWSGESVRPLRGAIYQINRLFRQTKSEFRRRFYRQFMSDQPCPTCQGERLCPEARFVTIGGLRLPEVTGMTISEVHRWVTSLPKLLTAEQMEIAGEVLKELSSRLQFMLNVGLHYLALNRPAPSLSGGEGQRIRLASQLGCGLVGVLYVLDEPSIGLHLRDHRALLNTLCQLRDAGNTVVVIEHDAETMQTADWLIDLGPGAGLLGGELVAAGTPKAVMANPASLTGRYLSGELEVVAPNGKQRRKPLGYLTVAGARLHNLKGIDVRFPLGVMSCVTGVSGSGKSSLVAQTLYPALSRALHSTQSVPGPHSQIEGLEQVNKVINISQSPIGRTPRSNPATYVRVMGPIRQLFAMTPEARSRGYRPGRFSFNVREGQCRACRGHGQRRVEMHFLPDVWVTCRECKGQRFNRQTLEIKYRGRSIADVLNMDVQEAYEFFADHPKIKRYLQTFNDVGLGYVKLGQSATTLSGGEAQRVKLAKELSRASTGDTVYVLDEPTTGLHFADIQKLLDVLHRLTEAGNTVIIIEHNMDVIKSADWIIDLGPEGGDEGGWIVAEGTPEEVARSPDSFTGQFLKKVL